MLIAGAVGVYVCARAGGAVAGVLAALAAACGAVLVLRVRPGSPDSVVVARVAEAGLLALPGAMVLYFSFNAGGFYPQTQAFAVLALAVLLAVHATVAERPFAGLGPLAAVPAVGLGLYALWTLLSGSWSPGPARALLEFDRALLYLLALLLAAALPRTPARLRWMLRGVAVAAAAVSIVALSTRLLPDVFPTAANIANNRLSFPLTYWNALGLLGALGAVLALHFSSDPREPRAVRVAGAAVLPPLACCVFFTFSRGAIAAGVVGMVLYCLVGRPRALATGLAASLPPTAVAVVIAYHSDLLSSVRPTTAAAAEQGHRVAVAVVACSGAAAALRLLAAPLDARLEALRLPPSRRRWLLPAAWLAGTALLAVMLVTSGAPAWASRNFDRFLHTPKTRSIQGDFRRRLTDPSNNSRVALWEAAIDGFADRPTGGLGAGTYAFVWPRERPKVIRTTVVRDAHSLYLEALQELGVVGLALLLVALLPLVASFLPLRRRPDRALYAALLASAAAWALHAAVDWDWEMPAVTVWLFALGGAALAVQNRPDRAPPLAPGSRLLVGVLLLACIPAAGLILLSQRHLERSARAFQRGDCRTAEAAAISSIKTLSERPEPYEALAYCQARRGNPYLALRAMRRAVQREPGNWEFVYGLALVRGAAGLDPRAAARQAKRMNPHEPIVSRLVRDLRHADRRETKRLTTALARTERLTVVR